MPKIPHTCLNCGSVFMAWEYRNRLFCNRVCMGEHRQFSIDDLLAKCNIVWPTACWEWMGEINIKSGYGQATLNYKYGLAHRIVYEELIGCIADGYETHHICRNKLCVNPDHLEIMTKSEHILKHGKGGMYCKNGHEFTKENTYWYNGGRECVICKSEKNARYYRSRQYGNR